MIKLTDDELELVTGGLSDQEIVNKINLLFAYIPESIRKEIINTLNTQGKKAAKALAEKLVGNNYPGAKELINLFN